MIELTCPQCGHQLRIDERYAGTQGRCKHCGGTVHVPKIQSEEPPPLPKSLGNGTNSGGSTNTDSVLERRKVLAVAKFQRLLIFSVLINIFLVVAMFSTATVPVLLLMFSLMALLLIPFVIYALWGLGRSLEVHLALLVPLALVGVFIPLIPLVVLNAQATQFLKNHNIPVGFLGAKRDALPTVTEQVGDSAQPTHSGFGIASFALSLVAAFLGVLLIAVAGAIELSNPTGTDIESDAAMAIGLGLFILLGMLLLGTGLGIVGLMQRNRKKVFAILGTIFSALALVGILFISFLGIAMG